MTQERFSKCEFIPTEGNHDFNTHGLSEVQNEKLQKSGVFTMNLDNTQGTGCDLPPFFKEGIYQPPSHDRGKVYNDSQITEIITGYSKDEFKIIPRQDVVNFRDYKGEFINFEISPLVKNINNSNSESVRIPNGAICRKIQKNMYIQNYYQLFDGIYTDPEIDDGAKNIYLVIDTGDDLIMKLGGSLQTQPLPENPEYNIHVIHSALTLADSATKTRPNGVKYNQNNRKYNNLKIQSWLFDSGDFNIDTNNEVFMSNYRITHLLNPRLNWNVLQRWFLPTRNSRGGEDNIYNTPDPHTDNNITTVAAELRIAITEGNNPNINLALQKKRSGDYLQILFAKYLPELLTNPELTNAFTCQYTPENNYTLTGRPLDYYKNNVFFVTGDFPAFSYAIYNRVNSIILLRNKEEDNSYTLSVTFKRPIP
jgi:hypothetical protein